MAVHSQVYVFVSIKQPKMGFLLCIHVALCFESLHGHTDRKVNANANARQTQTHTRRHYITTVYNRFANAMLLQRKRKSIEKALTLWT